MRFKKLAIITDCVHVQTPDGKAGTNNPIFLRQMEALASYFEETLICCPFVEIASYKQVSLYTNKTIHFLRVPNAGGTTVRGKLGIIKTLPHWYRAFRKINAWADVVYQRFPNNINIPGFFYFYYTQKKVFATYTGNWFDYKGEPLTYRMQKTLLKKWFRGPAGIYFEDKAHPHLFKTFSPSYTMADWEAEAPYVEAKKKRWQAIPLHTPVFIAVGLLAPLKNQQFILDCFLQLKRAGFVFELYIAGDGILKESYQQFVVQNQLEDCVFVTGRQSYEQLRALYRKADFLVHASLVEGYVKVPVEGFFHGVIPILNNFRIATEMVGNNERGYIFSASDKQQFIALIQQLLQNKDALQSKIDKGRQYASGRTMEHWQQQFLQKIEEHIY
jgi:glycosyltransferase involved in cell wall biosynthesis